jgi:rRNA maturation endonuclease Nob1
MPEYKCQNCGRHFFGWGVFLICELCGGKLEPVNKIAKKREIYRRQETN